MIKFSFLFQSISIGYKGFDILFLKVVENFDFICKYSMRDVESSKLYETTIIFEILRSHTKFHLSFE